MDKKKENLAAFYGIIVSIFWGLTFLSVKVALTELQPMTLAIIRFLIALVFLPIIAFATHTSLALKKKDIPMIALSSFVGITLYFFFENNGIMRLSATESSIIIGAIPILTLIIEMILHHSRPTALVAIGVLFSFIGIVLMVIKSEAAKSSPVGYFYMVGAAFSWVAYSFLTRSIPSSYSRLSITFWQIFFGMVFCIPFALSEGQHFTKLSTTVVLNVLFLGICGSALGYWLYVIMIDRLGETRSSVFINLIPVVSAVGSYFVLGERLAALQLFGGSLTVAGVFLATTPRSRKA